MSNIHDAAVLLTSLPEDDAAALMGKLDPKQVEQVSIEIARLRAITADEQEEVIMRFAESNPGSVGTEGGGLTMAQSLVEKALGKNANETLDNIRDSIEALPFSFL